MRTVKGFVATGGLLTFSPCGRSIGGLRPPFSDKTPMPCIGYGEAKTDEGFVSADRDPSSGPDFVRATFSHKGRREEAPVVSQEFFTGFGDRYSCSAGDEDARDVAAIDRVLPDRQPRT
jgi:hypothetical protein